MTTDDDIAKLIARLREPRPLNVVGDVQLHERAADALEAQQAEILTLRNAGVVLLDRADKAEAALQQAQRERDALRACVLAADQYRRDCPPLGDPQASPAAARECLAASTYDAMRAKVTP